MLDRTTGYDIETEELLDLSKPSLGTLSHILRHKELWPEGFEWMFSDCNHCAMGLAMHLWCSKRILGIASSFVKMDQVFCMPHEYVMDIFMGRGTWSPKMLSGNPDLKVITPEMVADQIDIYLENH